MVSQDYRAYGAFVPHDDEEDDDFPRFVGEKRVSKTLDALIAGKPISYNITPSEKYWFEVSLKFK